MGFATSCSRKQSLFFFSSGVFVWFNGLFCFGFGRFWVFSPSTPHRDEASMQFDKGSWNLTLLQLSVWLHSFWSLLSINISNIYFIRVLDFHPHGFYCASVSLLSKAIIFHIILHGCYHSLTCTSYSVIPINLVAW